LPLRRRLQYPRKTASVLETLENRLSRFVLRHHLPSLQMPKVAQANLTEQLLILTRHQLRW
jgi:hypothetical protein